MTTFDRVKKLADEQKISIVELEEKLNFGRNSLYAWKKKTPNGANLEKVADFFNVSTDYLLGRTDTKEPFIPNDDEMFLRLEKDGMTDQEFEDYRAAVQRFVKFARADIQADIDKRNGQKK